LVLAIAGNHDSPERLEFGSRIFAEQGIHIAGIYSGKVPLVKLEDSIGVVNFYLLPFIKPVNVRETLGSDVSNTDEAVCTALSSLPLCPDERNVLIAHQFVCAGGQAPETCDSETLSVGGSDQVNVSAFDGFDYVALGHLHRAQRIGRDTVRYAGSPLKYSLSEVAHIKSVSVVTLGKKGEVSVELLPISPKCDLRRIRGEIEDLLTAGRACTEGQDDYIWALLHGEPGLDPAERLRLVYPHLLHVELAPVENCPAEDDSAVSSVRKNELDLFDEFYQSVRDKPLSTHQRELLTDTITRLKGDSL
jgi:exonuclease SbcD